MNKDKKSEKIKKPFFLKRLRKNITFNIISGILLVMIVFSLISLSIGYWQFSNRFTDEYSDNAIRIADAAESYLSIGLIEEYLELEIKDTEEMIFADMDQFDAETKNCYDSYLNSYVLLQSLCDKVQAEFIYVIVPDTTDYEHITFVYNVVNSESGYSAYPIGYVRETTNDDYKEKYRLLYEGKSDSEIVVRDKGFIETGSHITAMIALKDFNDEVVGILCVQRQMDALTTARYKYTIHIIITFAVIVAITVLLYGFMLHRSLIRPIKRITNETVRFASDPSQPQEPLALSIKSRDEIGTLAVSVDTMERETLEYIDNLTKMTSEQQRIGTELDLAAKIQQGMLNTVFPDRPEFDIFASMTPAKEVGGDFYDFFMIDDDHLCLVIADVSGKGIPAALFMTVSKIVIADAAMVYRSPAEILRTVNERISEKNQLDMFITVWLGILELSTGKLTAANAGHEYPVIYRDGGSFELLKDKHGFVIGGMSGMKYRDYELTLAPGDAIFVYTDGLPEATNSEEELFGTARMVDALNIAPHTTPFALLSTVQNKVNDFVGDAPQFDDLTMLCVKYRGKAVASESVEKHESKE